MKKLITIMGLFGLMIVQAQVGINTDTPKATLDMKKDQSLAETTPQGVLFPKLTTAERTKFTDVEKGMMIYNTDKECVEIYTGIKNGVAQWNCMTRTTSPSAQNIAVTPVGFDGAYVAGVPMTAVNKVKFEIKNNSFSGIAGIDFSGAVNVLNGASNIAVNSTENKEVSLLAGASTILSYTLTGTPVEGTLTANFNKQGLQADQSTQVGLGTAIIADKTVYVLSLATGGTTIQGKINNGAEKLTIEIPYTQGQGSYNAFTNSQTSAAGQDGNTRNLKLDIPAGNFGVNGNLTATITVDSEYLVKQQTSGVSYNIVTFPISMGGSNFNVVVKGIGGILDRNFGNGTHDFIYLPVQVTSTHNVNGQPYKKTWLNMNLGAAYAKVGSPDFNILVNKTGEAAHIDSKLYGSYFQWQRKADGHELRNSATTSNLASSWTATGSWDSKFITTGSSSNYNWVSNGSSDTSGANVQLWQSGGANNPCPVGYHVPTKSEWEDLHAAVTGTKYGTSSSTFYYQTILPNFPQAGYRSLSSAKYIAAGDHSIRGKASGYYWSSNTHLTYSKYATILYLSQNQHSSPTFGHDRSFGFPVRCIAD